MAPSFKYIAKDKKGNLLIDTIQSKAPIEIARKLRNKGLYVIEISESTVLTKDDKKRNIFLKNKKIDKDELLIFTEQFSFMIKSGVSIIESLNIIATQLKNEDFKKTINKVEESVEKGSSLSEAMTLYPEIFPYFYSQMVKIGEVAGVLSEILNELREYYKWQINLSRKIKNALYYPSIVLIIAVISIILLLTLVIPSFVEIFNSFNTTLPYPTRIVVFLSSIIKKYYLYLILTILISVLVIKKYYDSENGKEKFDYLIFKIPYIAKVKKYLVIWRFSQMMSLLMKNGLPLLDSLIIIEDVMDNVLIKKLIHKAQIAVREGREFSLALEDINFFPEIMLKMVKTGEKSGILDIMLKEVSVYYRDNLEEKLKNIVTIIEPVMIIFLAVVVGFIAISVILPMFNMYTLF